MLFVQLQAPFFGVYVVVYWVSKVVSYLSRVGFIHETRACFLAHSGQIQVIIVFYFLNLEWF